MALVWVIPFVALILAGVFPEEANLLWKSFGFWIIFLLLLLLFYMPLIIQAAVATRDTLAEIPDLVALLIVCYPRPRSNIMGLGHNEIQYLRRIAETERDASDWRGSIVNYLIIGTLTATISFVIFFRQEIPASSLHTLSNQLSSLLTTQIVMESQGFLPFLAVFIIVIIVAIVFFALYRFYIYYLNFITTETANRTILLACDEAISVLKENNLDNSTELTFSEKCTIAEQLGCQIVKRNARKPFDRFAGVRFPNSTDEEWGLLISPKEYSVAARLYYSWQRMAGKITLLRLQIQAKISSLLPRKRR